MLVDNTVLVLVEFVVVTAIQLDDLADHAHAWLKNWIKYWLLFAFNLLLSTIIAWKEWLILLLIYSRKFIACLTRVSKAIQFLFLEAFNDSFENWKHNLDLLGNNINWKQFTNRCAQLNLRHCGTLNLDLAAISRRQEIESALQGC